MGSLPVEIGRLHKPNRLSNKERKDRLVSAKMNGTVDHPERNKVVFEKNGKVKALLTIGEAKQLRREFKDAGLAISSDYVDVEGAEFTVITVLTGGNLYKMYPL